VMDEPKTITATWKTEKAYDYTLLFAVIGICIAGIVAASLVISRRRHIEGPLEQRVSSR